MNAEPYYISAILPIARDGHLRRITLTFRPTNSSKKKKIQLRDYMTTERARLAGIPVLDAGSPTYRAETFTRKHIRRVFFFFVLLQ